MSGFSAVLPLDFSWLKSGDSLICRRMASESRTRRLESRNGMRQPHWLKASFDIDCLVTRMTPSEMNNPSVAVIWMRLV